MKTYILGELVTSSGQNLKSSWSPSVRSQTWVIPACEVRSVQAPKLPLRLDHGGEPVGRIIHLERRQGAIWAVAETDLPLRPQPNDNLYLSVEATWDEGTIGRDVEIRGASICAKSCMIALQPATFIRSGLNLGTGRSINTRERELIERASRGRHHGDPLIIVDRDSLSRSDRPPVTSTTPRIEYRSAEIADVSTTGRSLEVIVMPWDTPTVIRQPGRSFHEIVMRGAFDTIDRAGGRVRVNLNHDPRTPIGKATSFEPDHPDGLFATLRLAKTRAADEALELAREDVLDVSAGFGVEQDGETWPSKDVRVLRKLHLDHVALVSNPAYADARVLAVRDREIALH